MANHCLAKATADVGWATLSGFLEYKAARAGKAFVKCGRWYPSSKACSECGCICDKMPLDVRAWDCVHCGAHHDRDINAAVNIRDEGLRMLAGGALAAASGGDVSPGKRRNPHGRRSPKKLEARSFRAE